MKYIDAEKISIWISQTEKEFSEKAETAGYTCLEYRHKADALNLVLQKINSLQQDQPEVSLEKEYKRFIDCDNGRSMYDCARHFAEWGAIHLNARKEE